MDENDVEANSGRIEESPNTDAKKIAFLKGSVHTYIREKINSAIAFNPSADGVLAFLVEGHQALANLDGANSPESGEAFFKKLGIETTEPREFVFQVQDLAFAEAEEKLREMIASGDPRGSGLFETLANTTNLRGQASEVFKGEGPIILGGMPKAVRPAWTNDAIYK